MDGSLRDAATATVVRPVTTPGTGSQSRPELYAGFLSPPSTPRNADADAPQRRANLDDRGTAGDGGQAHRRVDW